MKREHEREKNDRGQKELIKCSHLEMLSHQWELIDSNVFLKSHVSCVRTLSSVALPMYLLASALS